MTEPDGAAEQTRTPASDKTAQENGSRIRRFMNPISFPRTEYPWRVASALAVALGVVVLLGWLTGIGWTGGVFGTVTMKANTAATLVLLGLGLASLAPEHIGRRRQVFGLACASIASLAGLATLGEWAFGWDLGVDQMLVTEKAGAAGTSEPGRMAAITAFCSLLGGTSLALLRARQAGYAQALSLAVGLAAFMAFASALYDFDSLKTPGQQTQMAVPTAVSFLLLSLGVLSVRPGGLMSELRSQRLGGTAARFLIPAAVVTTTAVGAMALYGQHLGLFGERRTHVVLLTADIGVAGIVVWLAARLLNRADAVHRSILNSSPDAVAITDLQGRIQIYSPEALIMFGFGAEDSLSGRLITDFVVPEDRERAYENISRMHQRNAERSERSPDEYRVRRADGSIFDVEVMGEFIREADGQPTGMVFDVRNTTDRKRTEAALAESERKLRLHIQETPVAAIEWDTQFRVISWNPAAERIFGYSAPEAMGRHADFIIPEDTRNLVDEIFARLLERAGGERSTNENLTRAGKVIVCDWFNTPLTSADGTVIGVASLAQDVTDSVRAGEALRESEYFFKESQRAAFIGSYKCDFTLNLWESSEVLDQIFGIDQDYVRSVQGWLDIVHSDDREMMERYLRDDVLGTGCPFNKEYRIVHQSTTEVRWVYGLGEVRLNTEGNVVSLTGTIQDITERKQAESERERLERELRQSQKLEAVGQLAAGVAHDFNNKLAVILGSADLAMATLGPGAPALADIEEIRTAAWRSADLTRQLLAFARMQPIAPKHLDLNETVASMLNMLSRLTGEGVGLDWIPDPLPCWVRIDPGQVDQVLVNLVVNARDAISGGGTIALRTANVQLDEENPANAGAVHGRFVVLEISDNGCGMDQETQARAFEPFFTTKPQGQGTGLGLATVHGIAHQNHGFIDVDSERGRGTTIRIYLPRAAELRTAEDIPMNTSPGVGTETVLLVEDEPALLSLTSRMLEQLGFTVLASGTPAAAIQLAAAYQGDIDLLVTDVVMPGMNGADLLRRLQSGRPHLRCLFVSGYPAKVLAETGVLGESVALLQKPYARETLALKLREVLARS